MAHRILGIFTVLTVVMAVHAKVTVATAFSDNMVLQRNMSVPVWGTADPQENVTVEFAGQKVSAETGSDGKWMIHFAPLTACDRGETMTVSGKNNAVEIKNILVGEVWLCSGQSNMEMYLHRTVDGRKYAAGVSGDKIRFIHMTPYRWSALPESSCSARWQILDPQNSLNFSAVAFHFARRLYQELQVPVGLISASWGGTRIEPWTPPCGFDSVPQLKRTAFHVNSKLPGTVEYAQANARVTERYEKFLAAHKAAATAGKLQVQPPPYPGELAPYKSQRDPTVIYNALIHPLVPFAFRGVIWYQGCSNVNDGNEYHFKMQALLNGWRKVFRQPEMPFYFVQLAPFTYGGNPHRLPVIWEEQQKFAAANRHTAMAVINDVGNIKDIHPTDKLTVAGRLALLALKYTYGRNELKADSPVLKNFHIRGNCFELEFNHLEKWLTKGDIKHFELCAADGKWVSAGCRIDGKKLVVSAPGVDIPVQLRYMWHENCEAALFNEAGLPLGAFRCGGTAEKADVIAMIENSSQLVYQYNFLVPMPADGSIKYQIDNSSKFAGKTVKRLTYFVELTEKNGREMWLAASMDAFTGDIRLAGVPNWKSQAVFAVKVGNLQVISNVTGVKNGNFPEGNIEFWGCDFVRANGSKIPGGSDRLYDTGDTPVQNGKPGYGSMQIHNFAAGQVVFAFNNFAAPVADIGIGNAPGNHPDWTFMKNSGKFSKATVKIYAGF